MDAKKTTQPSNNPPAGRTQKTPHRPAYIREMQKQRNKKTVAVEEAVQIKPARVGFDELKRRSANYKLA